MRYTGLPDGHIRIAHQHKTGVVVIENDKVIEIEPDPEMYGEE